jgi:hypothetical protein
MSRHRSSGLIGSIVTVILIAAAIAIGVQTFYCPCERTPGGWLLGSVEREPVTDWSFANEVPLCQIQVQVGIRPHAINLNCMASDGRLYLSCANCEGKTWSTAALERPAARLRLGDTVYPVTLTRVEEPNVLDEAWRAREGKMGRPMDRARQDGWWSFHVESRS